MLVAACVVLAAGLAADQHAANAADAARKLHLRVFDVAAAGSDAAGTSARLSVGAAGAPPATVAATVTAAPEEHVAALNTLLRVTGSKVAFADSTTEFAFNDPAVFEVLDATYIIFVDGVATVTYNRFDYKCSKFELLLGTPATCYYGICTYAVFMRTRPSAINHFSGADARRAVPLTRSLTLPCTDSSSTSARY